MNVVEVGLRVGLERFQDSQGMQDMAGASKSLYYDVVGAIAEAYFSYMTGEPWNKALRNFDGPDCGKYHVRASDKHSNSLIVRARDVAKHDLHEPFALVTVVGVTQRPIGVRPDWSAIVQGYLPLGECLRDDWKAAPNGRPEAWFVPGDELWPV